eukprot:c21955_g1_i3 orf=342-1568(-)
MGKSQVVFVERYDSERRKRSRRRRTSRAGCADCFVHNAGAKRKEEGLDVSSEDEEVPKKRRSLLDIYKEGPCNAYKALDSRKKIQRSATPNIQGNSYEDLVCKNCRRGDGEQEMLLCDGCDEAYHMYCLCPILVRVPKGTWFCPVCSKKDRIADFPLVQKKLIDFFRIERPLTIFSEVKRRKRHSMCIYKKKRKLLPHIPSKDPARRLQQMASLATALTNTGVGFSDELTYVPGLAPESANCASLERVNMQVISKEDKATLDLCKLMCSKGEWPPLVVTHDPRQGFVVEADSHIKDMTLIAEYTGDVDYMQNRLNDESDSLMALLITDDPSKELVICPDKRGNIARFISGINNHTLEGRKKQNLRCVRFDINGQVRVLLVAIRDISKGERLHYDYNAFQKEYPTHHFV